MKIPDEFRYSNDHEWASTDDGVVRIGITDYAQDALGDVVFVDLPKVGTVLAKGDVLGEVESTKSVSEIYAPVGGSVSAVNETLSTSPEFINTDPYGGGWICEVTTSDAADYDSLLDAEGYRSLTNS